MNLDIILYIITFILIIYLYKTNENDIMDFENTTRLSFLLLGGFMLVYISINLHQLIGMHYSIAVIAVTYLILSFILMTYYFGYKDNTWGETMTAFTIGQIFGLLVSTRFDHVTRFALAIIIILYTMFVSSSIGGIKSTFNYINANTMNTMNTITSSLDQVQMNEIFDELNTFQ